MNTLHCTCCRQYVPPISVIFRSSFIIRSEKIWGLSFIFSLPVIYIIENTWNVSCVWRYQFTLYIFLVFCFLGQMLCSACLILSEYPSTANQIVVWFSLEKTLELMVEYCCHQPKTFGKLNLARTQGFAEQSFDSIPTLNKSKNIYSILLHII